MTCPELINQSIQNKHVDLFRYELLHREGKYLISGWFHRAKKELNKDEVFEPFIFAWFAFNGWAACVTDLDRDRDILDVLAVDTKINNDFKSTMDKRSEVSSRIEAFYMLLPIFDVKSLRRNQISIKYSNPSNRNKIIEHYLSHGATKFEPKCWKRHFDAEEEIPRDWAHFINAVYKVRCNLFHGEKAAHSEMDQMIVRSALLALVGFLDEVDYLHK